jgi:hypothetical protein
VEKITTISEAKRVMAAGLGEVELKLAISFSTAIFWATVKEGRLRSRNGTAFFLNTGERLFGVTACHVIDGWKQCPAVERPGPLRLAGMGTSIRLDWDQRLIDMDASIDIATFHITESEVKYIGKTVLTGAQKKWPPGAPPVNCGVYYAGFPGVGTIEISPDKVSFGAMGGGGIATSVSEKDVSSQIEREHLASYFGEGIPAENYDFRGLSGGPMLAVVESVLRSWALVGVVYQGPNTSLDKNEAIPGLEIIRARRPHFILPDGKLDRARWAVVALG